MSIERLIEHNFTPFQITYLAQGVLVAGRRRSHSFVCSLNLSAGASFFAAALLLNDHDADDADDADALT